MENPFAKSLPSADDLMRESWKSFLERFPRFLYVFLLSIVALIFVATVLLALARFSGSEIVVFLALFAIFFAVIAITFVQNIMFFEIIKDKKVRIRVAFRNAIKQIKPYVKSLFLYFLVAVNLLIVLMFFAAFILLSALFISLLPSAAGSYVFFGTATALLSTFVAVLLIIPIVLVYLWQYFMFFDVIINAIPPREALDHSFAMIRKNKIEILQRSFVFILCYFFIIVALGTLSSLSSFAAAVMQVANFILSGWSLLFIYEMYDNVRKMSPSKADKEDRQMVSFALKIGSFILATMLLLWGFSVAFFTLQSDLYGTVVDSQTALWYFFNW